MIVRESSATHPTSTSHRLPENSLYVSLQIPTRTAQGHEALALFLFYVRDILGVGCRHGV